MSVTKPACRAPASCTIFYRHRGMTPGEYKNGEALQINYSFAETPSAISSSLPLPRGICQLAFVQTEEEGLKTQHQSFFPGPPPTKTDILQQDALRFFKGDWSDLQRVKTAPERFPFQLKAWGIVIKDPVWQPSTYGSLQKYRTPESLRGPWVRPSAPIPLPTWDPLPPGDPFVRESSAIIIGNCTQNSDPAGKPENVPWSKSSKFG